MIVKIVYFSGTGCTRHVANIFASEFQARGNTIQIYDLKSQVDDTLKFDLLVICYVVHACNAPEPIMNWIKTQKKVNHIPAVVISVSGGGEVSPNLACRIPLKNNLKKKNYSVVYEKMIVMPSNCIIETKPSLVSKLLEVLPNKISYIVDDVIKGNKYFTKWFFGNRLFTVFGTMQRYGAHFFGKNIIVNDDCINCGLCIVNCSVYNIVIGNNKPKFGKKCIMCLNCLYLCPKKALTPKYFKCILIKNGFNFNKILQAPAINQYFDINTEAEGFIWHGVKRYLSNTKDMLEAKSQKKFD